MKKKSTFTTAVLLALLLVGLTACEDSDVTAPEGSSLTLTPTPGTVTINQVDGEQSGNTTMVAQVVDAGGLPLDGVPLFFSTNGGLMASVDNVCTETNTCSRSPADACVDSSDCPTLSPDVILTNASGIVTDILTLRLFGDPDSVTVTVKGTNLQSTATVSKTVNLGPADAIALIAMSPPNGQRSGFTFSLDGSGSTFDPQVDPTCFEWVIREGSGASQIYRGPSLQIVAGLVYGDVNDITDEDDLTVELQISNNPDITCSPNPAIPAEQELFSLAGGDVLTYPIRCDFSPPEVDPIGDEQRSINGDGDGNSVSVTLTANGFDPQSPDEPGDPGLTYTWDCDNAQGDVFTGSTVSCSYSNIGEKSPEVVVRNRCQQSTQRGLTVTVTQ